MAIEKYIIDKSDLNALLRGEDLAIQPKGNIRGFCVEIAGKLTNGDTLKALFPTEKVVETSCLSSITIGGTPKVFSRDWWDSPYKAEKEEI